MVKFIQLCIIVLYLFAACSKQGTYYPEKHAELTNYEYEKYSEKLKTKYSNEDYFGIAFQLASLKAPGNMVDKYLEKAIKQNANDACESIYQVQKLANFRFYQTLYRHDTLIFQKAFKSCLNELGENSFDLYMENYNKSVEEHQKTRPQIDSTIMDVDLIQTLQKILDDDQKYRIKIDELRNTEEENNRYYSLQEETDSINLIKVASIIKTKGCTKPEVVGYEASRAIFLVLHHQPDLNIRNKYRSFIEECYPGGTLNLYDKGTSDLKNSQVFETIDERVNKCLEGADTTHFVLAESGKKGFSHDIDKDCILQAKLPPFEATDLNNQIINTESLTGKVNVINFWFTQCKPCIKEMPFLNTLTDKYKDQDINFIALNRDEIAETKSLLDKQKFNFRIIPDSEILIKKTFNMIWPYPFTIVTDNQNKVVGAFSAIDDERREQQIVKLIEENL